VSNAGRSSMEGGVSRASADGNAAGSGNGSCGAWHQLEWQDPTKKRRSSAPGFVFSKVIAGPEAE